MQPATGSNTESENMPHELSEWYCWSCHVELTEENGVCLTGLVPGGRGLPRLEFQCCRDCWQQIPPAERLRLSWLFKTSDQGGSGIGETLDKVRSLIEGALEGWRFTGHYGADEQN